MSGLSFSLRLNIRFSVTDNIHRKRKFSLNDKQDVEMLLNPELKTNRRDHQGLKGCKNIFSKYCQTLTGITGEQITHFFKNTS